MVGGAGGCGGGGGEGGAEGEEGREGLVSWGWGGRMAGGIGKERNGWERTVGQRRAGRRYGS